MSSPKRLFVCLLAFFALAVCSVFAQDISSDSDFVTSNTLPDSRIHFKTVTPQGHKNGMAFSRFGVPPSVDSLASFNGQFFAPGFDNDGNPQNHWYTSTVGNPPVMGGTTSINAPVIAVSVDLLQTANPTSAVRFHIDATQFLQLVMNSPIFQNTTYSSSNVPTQYED